MRKNLKTIVIRDKKRLFAYKKAENRCCYALAASEQGVFNFFLCGGLKTYIKMFDIYK